MIRCPKCGQENADNATNCLKCRINLQFVLANLEQLKADGSIEDVESARRSALLKKQIAEKMEHLLITTTPLIQGRTISQYLGVVSSVVVLGTGLLTELGGSLADITGTRASGFQEKIEEARQMALQELKEQSIQRDGDAIIGLDIDYMTLGANMLMVSANGTVIKMTPLETDSSAVQ